MHQIAKMMKNPKKAGLVWDSLMMFFNNNTHAVKRLLDLANLVNKYERSKIDDEGNILVDKERLVLFLDPEVKQALKLTARDAGKSINDFIELLLVNTLSRKFIFKNKKVIYDNCKNRS